MKVCGQTDTYGMIRNEQLDKTPDSTHAYERCDGAETVVLSTTRAWRGNHKAHLVKSPVLMLNMICTESVFTEGNSD